MSKLRAGLIGLGVMGKHHARVLSTLESVDFVGVCDPAVERVELAHGINIVPTLEQLINMNLDYAIVSVPTESHLEVGVALAAAGIHALIEKPLAKDYITAEKLTLAFNKANLIGAVGYIERFNPALQEARKRIDQLGTLHQIATRRQGPFPERVSDVGVIRDLATHDIDLTAWITGQKYVSVSARMSHRLGSKNEDLVAIIATLSEGTKANHLVNWLSPLKERVTILTGDKGAFLIDTLSADLTFFSNGNVQSAWDEMSRFRGVTEGDIIRYAFPKKEPLRLEHENFRDAILGVSTNIVTMEEGLSTVKTIEAIMHSAKINQNVELI